MIIRSDLTSLVLGALVALWALPAQAENIVINNGLAPPNPDYVIDINDDFSDDHVAVQNVGCKAHAQRIPFHTQHG